MSQRINPSSQYMGLIRQVESRLKPRTNNMMPNTPTGRRQFNPQAPQRGLPSDVAQGVITTPFGSGTKLEGFHPGIDIANSRGSRIGTGIPVTITKVAQTPTGFGNYVEGIDPYGSTHRWSHLANSYVKVGQFINTGGQIGAMGNSGSTYSTHGGDGTHLDYRIQNMLKQYVNPLQYPLK